MSETPPAMVLAAGFGRRLGDLGKRTPKALVKVDGEPMITKVVRALAEANIEKVVVNLHHLGEQVERELGDGSSFGVTISYSREREILDVAGGIANALPLLGNKPFVVVNADILSDMDFTDLVDAANALGDDLACLFLGENPGYHPQGDFSLAKGRIRRLSGKGLTYVGRAVYRPEFFAGVVPGQAAKMMPLWLDAIEKDKIAGRRFLGKWMDVGTPERIEQARKNALSRS